MKNYKTIQLLLILTPFVFSFAFGLDIYIPIVPQMANIFETSPALIQLTLSLFLFFTGFGQLLIGPLADQYGRKNIFYVSSVLYAIGAIGCAFSPDIGWLIFARVVSSFGACGMLVTSFALVRDLYSSDESAKMFSFLNGAIGISPTFAPIIGGYLAVYFGWQSVFYFLLLIGLLGILITYSFIKETHPLENRVRIDRHVFQRYLNILKNRQFLLYSTLAGFAEAVFFCFFSISPFIIIELHGTPTEEFGYYFAIFGANIGLGGFGSGKLIEKLGIQNMILLGITLILLGGASMLIWYHLNPWSLQGFLIPMAIACSGAMFLVGSCAAKALEPFGEIAGTAAAAFGSFEFGMAAIIGSIMMLFPTTSPVPYGVCLLLLAFGSSTLLLVSKFMQNNPIESTDMSL